MAMHAINFITTNRRLSEILLEIEPLPGFTHAINGREGLRVIITASLPEEADPSAKYILCSSKPHTLTPDTLSKLYDLWPQPLTVPLIHWLFRKVQEKLRRELEGDTRILEMARQDYLTGLATRWYLQEYLEANRHERNITCIYFDLDNFKGVNDTFGHQEGDRALAATAEMIQREFPDGFAARMGGDEFMLVLPGKRDLASTACRVREFMAKLMKYYAGMATMRKLSVSAGISQTLPDSGKTIDDIIHEADRALYEAKNSGKAQCRIYSPSMG